VSEMHSGAQSGHHLVRDLENRLVKLSSPLMEGTSVELLSEWYSDWLMVLPMEQRSVLYLERQSVELSVLHLVQDLENRLELLWELWLDWVMVLPMEQRSVLYLERQSVELSVLHLVQDLENRLEPL
jgi:hypothetical protein